MQDMNVSDCICQHLNYWKVVGLNWQKQHLEDVCEMEQKEYIAFSLLESKYCDVWGIKHIDPFVTKN